VLNSAHAVGRSCVKQVKWNEKAREFVRSLDDKTKIEIGALLMMLQSGESLGEPQSKPVKTIHAKAHELRIKDKMGAYRVIYVLSTKDHILIPHAFTKKTQKTPQKEIEISIKRLKELLNETK
jgi:phage-related protein